MVYTELLQGTILDWSGTTIDCGCFALPDLDSGGLYRFNRLVVSRIPDMALQNAMQLGIYPLESLVKVGDTEVSAECQQVDNRLGENHHSPQSTIALLLYACLDLKDTLP